MSERLLVIGGTGMLGHRLVLEADPRVETWWTARGDGGPARAVLPTDRLVEGVDIRDEAAVQRALDVARPTVVVNCAGTVKQRSEVSAAEMVATNGVFPHLLADACDAVGARLVHLSTDCVFSGAAGDERPHGYAVEDEPDPHDLYGRSKLVGEVDRTGHLTVRTSMIGPELSRGTGLLGWFLGAPDTVDGYANAHFSGLSTPALARALLILATRRDIDGLHHLAGPAIDKYTLVVLLRDALRPEATVLRNDTVRIDRRLDGRALDQLAGLTTPSWEKMVDELATTLRATGESR